MNEQDKQLAVNQALSCSIFEKKVRLATNDFIKQLKVLNYSNENIVICSTNILNMVSQSIYDSWSEGMLTNARLLGVIDSDLENRIEQVVKDE